MLFLQNHYCHYKTACFCNLLNALKKKLHFWGSKRLWEVTKKDSKKGGGTGKDNSSWWMNSWDTCNTVVYLWCTSCVSRNHCMLQVVHPSQSQWRPHIAASDPPVHMSRRSKMFPLKNITCSFHTYAVLELDQYLLVHRTRTLDFCPDECCYL